MCNILRRTCVNLFTETLSFERYTKGRTRILRATLRKNGFSKMAQYSLHTGVHNGANLIFRRQCAFGKTVVLQLPGNRCCVFIPDQGKRFFSSPNHSDRHEGPPRDRDDKSSARAKLTTHLHVRMTRATPPLCTQGQFLF